MCDHDLIRMEPWYILSKFSDLEIIVQWGLSYYIQAAFGLSNE